MSAKNVVLITGSDLADAALGMLEDYELVFAGRQPTEAQLIALCQQHNPVAIFGALWPHHCRRYGCRPGIEGDCQTWQRH